MRETYIVAKCVFCQTKRKVYAGEVERNDMPQCDEPGCYGICVAVSAEVHTALPERGKPTTSQILEPPNSSSCDAPTVTPEKEE